MYQKWYKKQAFSCNKTRTINTTFSDNNRVKTVSKTGIMVQAKDHQSASNFGGVSMATSWESVDVGCPFYRASDGIYIRCEGLAGLTMTIYFSDKQRKADLMERYCNCRWEDCPFHKEVAALYE